MGGQNRNIFGGLYNMIWTPPFRTPNMTYEKPVSCFASWASIVFLGVTKIKEV